MANKSAVQIRPASPMDSVNIVRLIKEGFEETPAKGLGDLDELKLLELVSFGIRHSFVLVAELNPGGRILGSIAVTPVRPPWCTAVLMTEQWFAVKDAYRTRNIPEQLLEALEAFLDKDGRPALLGTQMLTPAWADAVFAKRSRLGYAPSRGTFLRLACRHTNEKGQPVMPPRKAVGA